MFDAVVKKRVEGSEQQDIFDAIVKGIGIALSLQLLLSLLLITS